MGDLIYHSTLRHVYGLPDAWIRRLGRPDKIEMHRGQKVDIYSRARVEAFLESCQPEYLAMLVTRAKRSRRVITQRCRQAGELISWAKKVGITVGPLPETPAQLEQDAEASFRTCRAGDSYTSGYKAIVAHLRHTHSNYHALLAQLEREPGTTAAYLIIKRRVNQKIGELLRQQYGGDLQFEAQEGAHGD